MTDPNTEWTGAGSVTLGSLQLVALTCEDCDTVRNAPTNLPPGIALTPDPILQTRHAAYAVSARRRMLTVPMRDP